MTQKVFPFLNSSLEAPEFLNQFRRTIRSGVARNSEVTTGTSGWKLTVKAGEIVVDGSWISDDLDKIDGLDLGHVGGDKHYAVYQTYSYLGTNPPSASAFAVSAGAIPPTQPTIPANSVKLCDVFVPSTALSIGTVPGLNQTDPVQVSSTGVRIVQAPRLWPVNDTDELIDRLSMAMASTFVYTQGAINYDDANSKLFITQPVTIQTQCTTNRQAFNNAPAIVRSQIAANTPAGATVPGTIGSRDVIIYTTVDRSSPVLTGTSVLKFINRLNPTANELNELYNQVTRTQVVILGIISGSKMFLNGIQGQLPLPDGDSRKFLKNDSGGSHEWQLVQDTSIVGGVKSVANQAARDAIPVDVRKLGSVVYNQADDVYESLIGGIANLNFQKLFDDGRLHGGFRVLDWTYSAPTMTSAVSAATASISLSKRKQGMIVVCRETGTGFVEELTWDGSVFKTHIPRQQGSANWGVISGMTVSNPSGAVIRLAPGQFMLPDGLIVTNYVNFDAVSTLNQRLIWDRSAGDFALSNADAEFDDFVFAYVRFASGSLRKLVPCAPRRLKNFISSDLIRVGNDANSKNGCHFDTHYHAMVWRSAFDSNGSYKKLFTESDAGYSVNTFSACPGTITAPSSGSGATIIGSGTRFLRDFDIGDWIRVGNLSLKVQSVGSDTSLTVVNLSSSIPTATTYTRPDWSGPHSHLIDFTKDEFSAISGIEILGDTKVDLIKTNISWGANLSGEPVAGANPFTRALGRTTANFTIKNINLSYLGSPDAIDFNTCAFSGIGANWLIENVNIEPTGLTCVFNLNQDIYTTNDKSKFAKIKDVSVESSGMTLSSIFKDSTAGIFGGLSIDGLVLSPGATGSLSVIFDLGASSELDLDVRNMKVERLSNALVMQNLAGDWAMSRSFTDCEIEYGSSGNRMIAVRTSVDVTDAMRVNLYNCKFSGPLVNFTGLNLGVKINSTTVTVQGNNSGKIIDYIGATPTINNNILNKEEIILSRAMTSGLIQALSPLPISRVVHYTGLNLSPFINAAQLERGTSILFPNGRYGVSNSLISTGNLDIFGTNAITPSTIGINRIMHFFARISLTQDVITDIYWDTRTPQINGSLNLLSTPHSGFTRNDYRYIGVFVSGISSLWTDKSLAVNYSNGQRAVSFNANSSSSGTFASVSGSPPPLVDLDTGPFNISLDTTNLFNLIPAVHALDIITRAVTANEAANIAAAQLSVMGNTYYGASRAATFDLIRLTDKRRHERTDVPFTAQLLKIATAPPVANAFASASSLTIEVDRIYEDLNNISPYTQAV